MEVMDSHMSEHFSAQTPAHIDVDMSAEYDDDAEYAMHDLTEATTTTNDEEIYDAEFEDAPEHAEIEMDEYADETEVVEDDETHMGTYVPTEDAATVTDVTVEDVQLRSSPVPAVIPQVAAIPPISPHVALDADLPLNEAREGTLADHSPHSVATLVGDSEIEQLPADTTKEGTLNEVIDLTGNDDGPQIAPSDTAEEVAPVNPVDPIDQPLPQPEHEVTQDELDEAEQEFYDTEEPVAEFPTTDPTAPDQAIEQQDSEQQDDDPLPQHTDQHEPAAEAPTYLEIPEQTEQDGHSPIEEALVINQQVRDDAADSMEPSPPVRLYYRDESKSTDEIFDLFTSTGLESHETVLLFHDTRTLFYEPLSMVFAKLRETEYFSGDEWENTEMGIRMDLEGSNISINEDHKETENISLFKLSSIWSGLGLEEPLELSLFRGPERFVVQLARLVQLVEHRDIHNEDVAGAPEIEREAETGDLEINSGDLENDNSESAPVGNNGPASEGGALILPHGRPGGQPRDTHENENENEVAGTAQSESVDGRLQSADEDGGIERTREIGADTGLEETAQAVSAHNQDPIAPPTGVDYQGTETESAGSNPQNGDDNTGNIGQSPRADAPEPQEDEYDEYEAEGENGSTPAQTSTQNNEADAGWDTNEYDYEEDYEAADDEEHGKGTLPTNNPNEPTDSDHRTTTPSTPKLQGHDSQNSGLKRNLDELEYEEYETPSAPSSPASAGHRRIKHART